MIDPAELTAWLSDEDYEVSEASEPPEGAAWHLVAQRKGTKIAFHLFGEQPEAESLVIQREISLAPPHRNAISDLSDDEFQGFKFALVRDLLLTPIQYRLEIEGQVLSSVGITKKLYEQDVSRSSLFEAIHEVNAAGIMSIIHVRRVVGDPI